jgi:hypothetical protein
MFLDKDLDPRRLELASNLGIAVVVERADRFVLTNPAINEALGEIFQPAS